MIILLCLLIFASIVLIIRARKPMAFWMACVFLGWFLSMLGYIIFLSKYGGYDYRVNRILYLFDDIRVFFLYFSISLNWISRLLSVGRSIFAMSLVGLSLSIATFFSKKTCWYLFAASALICLVNILIYEPALYRQLLYLLRSNAIYLISVFIRLWILLTIFFTFYCLLNKYYTARLQFLRQQLKYIMLCVLALTLFYFYLVFMGPIQLTDLRTYYFLYTNFGNFNPPLTIWQWAVFIGFTGVTSVAGIFAIWKYSDVGKRLDTSDLSYEQKFLSVNHGVSVITHSLKNQLLMIDVLSKKTGKAVNHPGESINVAEVTRNLHEISAIANQTLQRITQLYKAFKDISLNLKPYRLNQIIEKALENVKFFPENVTVQKNITDLTVVADRFYLSEAIANLIINAVEAIGDRPGGRVVIASHSEGSWCVLEIEDNGGGISPNEIDRIFDPFYTHKITTKNWGIGLSYAKQIIKAHCGYIQVKSRLHEGSTFSIVLPVMDADLDKTQQRD
jgi:signal transduction histidine kinase